MRGRKIRVGERRGVILNDVDFLTSLRKEHLTKTGDESLLFPGIVEEHCKHREQPVQSLGKGPACRFEKRYNMYPKNRAVEIRPVSSCGGNNHFFPTSLGLLNQKEELRSF